MLTDDEKGGARQPGKGEKRTGYTLAVGTSALLAVATFAACMTLGVFIFGVFVAIFTATWTSEAAGVWFREFFKSPGAAACVALVAAGLTFWGLSRQLRVSRSVLQHEQAKTENASWWQMFEWTTSRGLPSAKDDTALPISVTVTTLQELATRATNDVQSAACAGVIDHLGSPLRASDHDPDGTPSTIDHPGSVPEGKPQADVSAMTALSAYVTATAGSPAASAVVEGLLYEREVIGALEEVIGDLGSIRANPGGRSRSGGIDFYETDALLALPLGNVLVDIHKVGDSVGRRAKLADRIRQLGRASRIMALQSPGDSKPQILILTDSAKAVEYLKDRADQAGVVLIRWATDDDSEVLRSALAKYGV
ncbi:hypothetical protein [Clavibacter lycopersici]|uniref:hypothetical protein n=1 Tax=Clavibacter lycopersici TaxID=2301718 RepID=UPI0011C23AC2|nr:hypothetical protein [Clavibacter lycopersici]